MRVLVTGASGFVGGAVCARLRGAGMEVRPAVRTAGSALPGAAVTGELGPDADFSAALEGMDAVIHLAARVHVMHDTAADPEAEFQRANVQGTLRLARQAADAGVRRLVFVSSVKVNGEQTRPGEPFRADDRPDPSDAYGRSKRDAEQGLREIAGLDTVVVRPPLVYGPGVGANFARLMRAVDRGIPLPLGGVRNRRSLVSVGNLADALLHCATHPAAAGKTYLVSDGSPLSTPELIRALARALDRPARLLPVPEGVLRAAAGLAGRSAAVDRLCGSLVVDDAPLRGELAWTPPETVDAALARTADAYRKGKR